MSKDEYLITDAPLKALTVFAMPMILGSDSGDQTDRYGLVRCHNVFIYSGRNLQIEKQRR